MSHDHSHVKGGADDGYDRTSLQARGAGQHVHRDYAAHYFRWGWAVSQRANGVGLAGKKVLDIGCGVDLPLMYAGRYPSALPELYVGVDLNKLKDLSPGLAKRAKLYGSSDFLAIAGDLLEEHGKFDVVVSFENIEHMPPENGWQLLWWMRQLTADDGCSLLSTPVMIGSQAANHVHEYGIDELQHLAEQAGFTVAARYGTFARQQKVMPAMREWCAQNGHDFATFEAMINGLLEFHSWEVLSNFVSPLIPDASSNNAWKLVPRL